MMSIYLDTASTTFTRKEVLDSYKKLLDISYANTDSLHTLGNESKHYLDKAREQIASLLKVKTKEVFFTSGSTESNNIAIKGVALAYKGRGKHLITSAYEHPSVLDSFKWLEENLGFEVTYLEINKEGSIDLEALKKALRKDTILVSIMGINNEIGAINDIYSLSKYTKENSNAIFHSDLTQSMGKEKMDLSYVDIYNFSSHKIYGVKGSGVLVKKEKVRLTPLISGGEQEMGVRPGTINYPSHVATSKALRLVLENYDKEHDYVKGLRNYLIERLESTFNDNLIINSPKDGSAYLLNFAIKGKRGEVIVNALSSKGIYISSRSACSSYSKDSSTSVYELTHDTFLARNSLRVSFSYLTSKEELDIFVDTLSEIVKGLKG